MKIKTKTLKISEFSKITGLSIKALRIYESSGLLIPLRCDKNQYRLYSEEQVSTAKEIRRLRLTGFSVREIKALLPFRDQSDRGTLTLIQQQLLKTEQTIVSLLEQRKQLKRLIIQMERRSNSEPTGLTGIFGRRIICKEVSESIKGLTSQKLLEKTRRIPNEEYLRTMSMVDDVAKAKLLSVLSEKAVKLVRDDLAELDYQYAQFWK